MDSVPLILQEAFSHHQAGDLVRAEHCYRQVLERNPSHIDALHLLGIVALQTGRTSLAGQCIAKAIELKPDFAEAHSNLGNVLEQAGKLDEAIASWRQALRFKPQLVEVLGNLGLALIKRGELDEAEAVLREGLRLRPDYADAHNHLGNVLEKRSDFAAAIAHYQEALRSSPNHAQARLNMGVALHRQGQLAQAVSCYQHALGLQPNLADAHYFYGMALLAAGNLEQGWAEYEWRWKTEGCVLPQFVQPAWDGNRLDGRTILLYTEQALGDTLQFIRFAQWAKAAGGTVLVRCQRALVPLLSRCPGIDRLLAEGEPLPRFDVHAPLMSLPRILHIPLDKLTGESPYIFADPQLIAEWGQKIPASGPLRIGIAWQGNPQYMADRERSIPLEQFAPLASMPGVRLYSLQKGQGTEQLRAVEGVVPVTILADNLDQGRGAFMDTAAIINNLDLVITSDTAIAHLAGALGAQVWVALSFASDWRWHLHRDDSPWYRTMRLFRQPTLGDWLAVFEQMAGRLRDLRPSSNPSQLSGTHGS